MYSNTTYKYDRLSRYFNYSCFSGDEWELYSDTPHYSYRIVMWLDEAKGEFAVDKAGELLLPEECAIDEFGYVYLYNYDEDALELLPGASAYNAQGMALRLDERSQLLVQELIIGV